MTSNIRIGDVVTATKTIREGRHVHARKGEAGRVVDVADDGVPTVQFDRTGTSTIVDLGEARVHPARLRELCAA